MTRLWAGRSGARILERTRYLSLLQKVQSGSGAYLVFYSTGIRASVPGIKRPGREVNRSPLSSAEVNECSCTSAPLIHLHGVYREHFTFTFTDCYYVEEFLVDTRKCAIKCLVSLHELPVLGIYVRQEGTIQSKLR